MPSELQALLGGTQRHQVGKIFEQRQEVEINGFEREFLCFDLGEIEHVVDHRQQRLGTRTNDVEVASLFVIQRRILHQRGHAHDAVHRRTDLVRHHRQESRFGTVGGLGPFACGDQIFLDANSFGDVIEGEDSPDDAFIEILRQRLALEDPPILEMQNILRLVGLDNGAHALVANRRIDQSIGNKTQDLLIVVAQQHRLGNLPHGTETPVHARHPALPVEYENPVPGRLQRRPQLRCRVRQIIGDAGGFALFLRLHQQPVRTRPFDNRNRLGRRAHRTVGAEVHSFLRLHAGKLPVTNLFPVKDVLQRTLDIQNRHAAELLGRIPENSLGRPVGEHNVQRFRLDQKDHLLETVERETLERTHGRAVSVLGEPVSK